MLVSTIIIRYYLNLDYILTADKNASNIIQALRLYFQWLGFCLYTLEPHYLFNCLKRKEKQSIFHIYRFSCPTTELSRYI